MEDNLIIQCQDCGYKWNGDSFEEDCPNCESENIEVVG